MKNPTLKPPIPDMINLFYLLLELDDRPELLEPPDAFPPGAVLGRTEGIGIFVGVALGDIVGARKFDRGVTFGGVLDDPKGMGIGIILGE